MKSLTKTAHRLMTQHYGPFFAGKYMEARDASLRAARASDCPFDRRQFALTAMEQHKAFLRVMREVRREQ